MWAMERDNLSELLPDFKCSLVTPLQIDGFATFVAYRVQPHRRQKRAYTGYAQISGYNIGRTQEYARTLFDNQFLHGVAAQNAIGVDTSREVVNDSIAAASNSQLTHHAALHVVDSEGGGLGYFIADVHLTFGGIGISADMAHHHGLDTKRGSLETHNSRAGDGAVGDFHIIHTVGILNRLVHLVVDTKWVVTVGGNIEWDADQARHALFGAEGRNLDAVAFDLGDRDNEVLKTRRCVVVQGDSLGAVVIFKNHSKGFSSLIGLSVADKADLCLCIQQHEAAEQECKR